LPDIQKIVAGGKNGIALDADGNIWEWGRNEFGELGRGDVDPSNAAHPTPKMVEGLPTVVSVASQGPTVLAADADGQIYAWGFDKWGAVGDGETRNTGTPQLVLTLPTSPDSSEPSVQVAAAHRSSYAFNVITGETYAWGENNYGQIGIPANGSPNPFPINITDEILPTLSSPTSNCRSRHAESDVGSSHDEEVDASHQIVQLLSADTVVDHSTSTRFVFNPGVGQEDIYGFRERGAGHDVLSLPTSDAGILAEILMNATYDSSGTTLHLGHGDSIELMGVTKSDLRAHPDDFAFHGLHKA
jgi:alpha-tubulin suppressor-like RCC1 family protein